MKRYALMLLMLLSFNLVAEEKPLTPTKSGLYDIGGFSLYLECYERNKPTLILEQGFGRNGSDGVWLANIQRLQNDFSICLYDRAGLGKSEKGPVPFTVNDMAERLQKLLVAGAVPPPYYFAGGSYASYIISAYHQRYPDNVLGAVWIDPPPFGYFHTKATRWPKDFHSDNPELMGLYRFEQSVRDPLFERVPENVDHIKSYQQLSAATGFGDKPLIIVRAKQDNKPYDPEFVPAQIAEKMTMLYANAEVNFQKQATAAKVVYSDSDRHHLHISDPDLVVSSISALLNNQSSNLQ
ncbi:hypothetical protein GCM10009092_25890 [Bowmanella denitrificans]|uniref:AB hydrolase-1 domain-containing protein n=1 Tax=Bowmanella denitrificans TaxID=366582 RepID=A0ABN0XC12_9ALTE